MNLQAGNTAIASILSVIEGQEDTLAGVAMCCIDVECGNDYVF